MGGVRLAARRQMLFGLGCVALLLAALVVDAEAVTITPQTDANALRNALLGPGVSAVGPASFTGATGTVKSAGTFTSGAASGIGIDSGVILSTGNVLNANTGGNTNGPESLGSQSVSGEDANTDLGLPGDPSIAGSLDATSLEFQFQFGDGSVGGDLFVNYVFASEEYINYVGSQFNDAFRFFLDGTNIALVPSTSTPVAINSVNPITNSAYYRNNVANPNGIPVAGILSAYDGFTTVFRATATGLGAGPHTMKFLVTDVADAQFDSAVFIQAGSFSSDPQPIIPEPSTFVVWSMLAACAAGAGWYRQRRVR